MAYLHLFFERGGYMRYQIQENCLTIFLPKDVDHCHVEDIRSTADKIIEKYYIKHIIFDFEDTQFMDSSGIGVIMGRYRLICMLGGEVWAVHTSKRIKKLLAMSGVTKLIQLYEEEEVHESNQ